jgi:hypothetical protein
MRRARLYTGAAALCLLAFCSAACAPRSATPPASSATRGLADADTVRSHTIIPGVSYVYAWDHRGPWAIHIVEIDTRRCVPVLRAVKAGPPLSARATTSDLTRGAIAGINADFFALPSGTTVGAHVTGGDVLIGPGLRPVFAVTDAGFRAGSAALRGFFVARDDTAAVAQINRPLPGDAQHPAAAGLTVFTDWFGAGPPDSSAAIHVRRIGGDVRAGRGVVLGRAVAAALDSVMFAVAAPAEARAWLDRRSAGDTVTWRIDVIVGAGPVAREAVGGFPLLLHEGRDVLGEQPGVLASFGEQRHPRTAIGWNGGRLLLVIVDGRQAPYSDGMSLAELTWLFVRLGADEAINLDGGGSTAMIVRDSVMNRPSDATGQRPVGNALVLSGCR